MVEILFALNTQIKSNSLSYCWLCIFVFLVTLLLKGSVLYRVPLISNTKSIRNSILYVFIVVFVFGVYVTLPQWGLFLIFHWAIECVVILVFTIFLFYTNFEGYIKDFDCKIFITSKYTCAMIFFFLNNVYLYSSGCTPLGSLNIFSFFWGFYVTVFNTSINDFSVVVVSPHEVNMLRFLFVGVVLLVGSVLYTSTYKTTKNKRVEFYGNFTTFFNLWFVRLKYSYKVMVRKHLNNLLFWHMPVGFLLGARFITFGVESLISWSKTTSFFLLLCSIFNKIFLKYVSYNLWCVRALKPFWCDLSRWFWLFSIKSWFTEFNVYICGDIGCVNPASNRRRLVGCLIRGLLRLLNLILIFTLAPTICYLIAIASGAEIGMWVIYTFRGEPNILEIKDLFTWMITAEDIQWRKDALIYILKNREGRLLRCAESFKNITTPQVLELEVKSTENDGTAGSVIKRILLATLFMVALVAGVTIVFGGGSLPDNTDLPPLSRPPFPQLDRDYKG